MYSFVFLGKDSFLDYDIVIEERPPIPKPKRSIEYIDIPGRNGSLKVDSETYKDVVIPIKCGFKGDDVAGKADEVKAWLDSGEGQLIFSNQVDRYYIAHVSDQFDITQEWKSFGQFQVNFRCRPFKYDVGDGVITLTEPGIVYGSGTRKSKPAITVYGTGTIDLTVNSSVIHLTNVVDYVTIDSNLMDAYKGTLLKNGDMLGEFPELVVGENAISWTGSVTKVEIFPNWCYL